MKSAWLLSPVLLLAAAGAVPSPTSTLRAKIEGLQRQSVPREISVRVRPTLEIQGNEKLAWETDVTCPVRNGEWVCEVPAGRVDLKIHGAAMTPIYKWGQTVRAGETTDLDMFQLRRGASIAGWVQTDGRQVPTHSVLLTLHPQRVGSGMAGLSPKPLRTFSLESNSRPWGFFHFQDVQPGSYVLTASEPDRPLARFGPIRIEGERSFELPRPILLVNALDLRVSLHPSRSPDGKPWGLQLIPKPFPVPGEDFTRVESLPADEAGSGTFRKLAAGDYILKVLSQGAQWMEEEIRLEPEKTSFSFRVPTREVYGHVTQGGEPLQAEVLIRSQGASFRFSSDREGRFHGFVADREKWEAYVSAPGRRSLSLQKPVQFSRNRADAGLHIRIPGTWLPVEVVDEQGRRVPRAQVNVEDEVHNGTLTDERGEGEFWGLEPGRQILKAAHLAPPREGDAVEVLLKEDYDEREKVKPLRLVLPGKIDIRGRVKPRFGSAPGARVVAWPSRKDRGIVTGTDEDGDFRLSLPVGTQRVTLLLLVPGSCLRWARAEVDPGRILEIPVEAEGGTLVLEMPEQILERATAPPDPKSPKPVTSVPYMLHHWADLQDTPQSPGRLVVPNVAPGLYTLCAGDPPRFFGGRPRPGDGQCVSGVLEASGELTLRLPAGL
jgi:hypothetical protein